MMYEEVKANINSHNMDSQMELLKVVAELNQELIFDYDANTQSACIYEVKDGQFAIMESANGDRMDSWEKIESVIFEEDHQSVRLCAETLLQKPSQNIIELRILLGQGEYKWYRLFAISEIVGDGNQVNHIAGRMVCVDQEKQMNEMNRKKAELDALTGIYNHITFENISDTKLVRHKSETIFIMIDIDNFKQVNDTLGHYVGDLVISKTGEVLRECVKGRGIAGRLGGDEFAALVWSFKSDKEIRDFVKNLRKALKDIKYELEYSASIGVSVRKKRVMTFKDMYYEADQSAYYAKRNGKDRIIYFDEIEQQKEFEVEIEEELAVADEELKALDDLQEIILVADELNHKIQFVNREAVRYFAISKNIMMNHLTLDDVIGKEGVENCLSKDEYWYLLNTEIKKKEPHWSRDIHLQAVYVSKRVIANGKASILISIMPIEKPEYLIAVNNRQNVIRNILYKTIELFKDTRTDERNHAVLRLLMEFYDGDCLAIITPNVEGREEVYEVHREAADSMARHLKMNVARGMETVFEHTLGEEDLKYLSDVSVLKNSNRQAYEELVGLRIWSSITLELNYQNQYCGKMLLLNPRKNIEQKVLLKNMCNLISAEILSVRQEERRAYEETHDRMTNLLNRNYLSQMEDIWHLEDNEGVGVVYVDIINLTDINHRYGHQKGNEYICMVAKVMSEVFTGYRVCRYEMDQIFAVCTNVDQTMFEIMVDTAREAIEELPFVVAFGYAWGSGLTITELLDESKSVMAQDKAKLKNGDRVYQKEHQKAIREVLEVIEKGHLKIYMQPKMNIRSMKLSGAEALVRYQDPVRGILGPALFIPVMEQLDVIHLVDLFVLEEIFKYQKNRVDKGLSQIPISVNISKKTLMYAHFIENIRELVCKYDIPSELIELEITESIGDLENVFVAKIANSLHAMGFLLSMDDFGTKYSNLAMLSSFDFQVAKIDRSIVLGVTKNVKSLVILKHLTRMIKELGITCIVEGVETVEELELILQTDCDYVQGYYFSPPLPIEQFEAQYIRD